MPSHELQVRTAAVALAGTLHLPEGDPPAPGWPALLMVGGSGPTDRDNDVYFAPIRAPLLAAGIAVASFDKRGVGGSTGDWLAGGPAELTADALAQAAALRDRPEIDASRVGLFGHSQGGWVVLEVAAADPRTAFVITNSGPAVTPYLQERYAVAAGMRAAGETDARVEAVLARFDRLADLIRQGAPLDALVPLARDPDLERYTLVPVEAGVLGMMRRWTDHDPRPAIERITAPLLAIFGADDRIVPVEDSLRILRDAREGRPGGLDELVIAGGDHRSQVGDPPALPARYHEALAGWIRARV